MEACLALLEEEHHVPVLAFDVPELLLEVCELTVSRLPEDIRTCVRVLMTGQHERVKRLGLKN